MYTLYTLSISPTLRALRTLHTLYTLYGLYRSHTLCTTIAMHAMCIYIYIQCVQRMQCTYVDIVDNVYTAKIVLSTTPFQNRTHATKLEQADSRLRLVSFPYSRNQQNQSKCILKSPNVTNIAGLLCLLACLLACLFVRPIACLLTCLLACCTCLLYLLASLPACLLVCLLVCWLACLLACSTWCT